MNSLIVSLQRHASRFPDEKIFCDATIAWIQKYREFAFVKDNLEGHITASMLITNIEKTKVLLMFHKKLQMWVQFGGHADGESNTLSVAIREFHEESGIDIEPDISPDIFVVDVHTIPLHGSRPLHKHFDIMYLASIPDTTPFSRQEEEVDDIRWFDIADIENTLWEKWMVSRIRKIATFAL